MLNTNGDTYPHINRTGRPSNQASSDYELILPGYSAFPVDPGRRAPVTAFAGKMKSYALKLGNFLLF
jgi:hypothetical protein